MTTIAAVFIFFLGTTMGSFLSVVNHRIRHKEKGILFSRSICPNCKKKIKWQHLIPIFSWLYLRGKCAYCGKKISGHYIAMELAAGLLFLAAFFQWNFIESIPLLHNQDFFTYLINWQTFSTFSLYAIEFTFFTGIFFYDLMHKEIPDRYSLPAILIAIAGAVAMGQPSGYSMLFGGVGILTFFMLQFLISKGSWIGGGDLRFGLLMGVLLGWEKGILAIVLSYILGAIISLMLLAQKKANRKTAIPFGPFLIMGTLIAIFFGEQILNWYFGTLLI